MGELLLLWLLSDYGPWPNPTCPTCPTYPIYPTDADLVTG